MKNSEKKLPPQVVFNFREENMGEEVNAETGEENPNFVYDEDEPNPDALQELEISEKPVINKEDIFESNDSEEEIETIKENSGKILIDKPEKKVISKIQEKPLKEKKKRKPMSEEHKAKLKVAREKAMAVRKANAIERKEMKAVDNEEKELLKKQKVKRVQKLKKEVESEEEEAPVKKVREPSYPTSTITKKDLEDAQLDAIMKYEALRKKRKAEKKQAEMVENERLKMLNTINKATGGANYRYRDGSNRFDNCY